MLELFGLVDARVVDHDGVYDPRHPNDRLLLGMKGSISEFELGVLRTRMVEAARAKARDLPIMRTSGATANCGIHRQSATCGIVTPV